MTPVVPQQLELPLRSTARDRSIQIADEQLRIIYAMLEKDMTGYTCITKDQFYRYGGFSNPRLLRVTRNGVWAYFQRN